MFTTTCKVDYTDVTQLKLQKNKKKVILHCTTLTFWRCIAEYYHLFYTISLVDVKSFTSVL